MTYQRDDYDRRKSVMLDKAETKYAGLIADGLDDEAACYRNALDHLVEDNWDYIHALEGLWSWPVSIEVFVNDRWFLGDVLDVWPALMEDLRAMNPYTLLGEEPVYESLLGGATGTGKTTLAHITTAYQVYKSLCWEHPQDLFNLSRSTPIITMFQSVSGTVTRRVLFSPFRTMFLSMPYVRLIKRRIAFDQYIESRMEFASGVQVVQALANVQSVVGQAIIGGILDEANFMQFIPNSTQVPGPRGEGGLFDQAESTYTNLRRRRRSRFVTRGPSIGSLCIISSTRYNDDFLDRRMAQVRETNEPNIFMARHRQYDVQPRSRYSGETFRLLIGTTHYPTKVLYDGDEEGRHYPEGGTIEDVPIEYYHDFMNDPENALRDIIGIATDTITPFISQRNKIVDAIVRGREIGLQQWCLRSDVELAVHGMPQIEEANLPTDRERPRFVHVDLSISSDRCGIAVIKPLGHVAVNTGGEAVEMLPAFAVECAVSIKPSETRNIEISEIRNWIMNLKTFYRLNIHTVSYDGFQSKESIQILRQAGVWAMEISVDRTSEPYSDLRRAFYQDRISMVDSEMARHELANLEFHADKDRVDHPPKGSKDVADAICGAVYSASRSPHIRAETTTLTEDGRVIRRPRPVRRRRRRRQ